MTMFDERERALEAKFAHDEELRFRAKARRDKLLAQWAASQLGLSEAACADLVASVVAVHDGADHDARLLHLIQDAFTAHGRLLNTDELLRALERCSERANEQVLSESWSS